MPKKKVLVTGGAGFIGSHLVSALLKDGFLVRVLDNLAPPVHNNKLPPWVNKRAEYIKGDVRNKKDWIRALKGVSYVFHLAAYMDYLMDFSTYYTTNTASTALMYEVIVEKKYPVKKIIAASSQSVYGEGKYRCRKHGIIYPAPRPESQLKVRQWELQCPHDGSKMQPVPQREDDTLTPTIPYGISKRTLEDVMWDLGRRYNIPSVALRYTIVHGPNQSFRHFYSGALRQLAVIALTGQPFTMHEDGRQIRDYVHVKDVVAAHMKVLKSPRANFEAFNVGSGRPTRVIDLAKTIAKVVGRTFSPNLPGLYRVGAPRHSIASIKKLNKLGWTPQCALEDNVRDYVKWIRQYPEAKKYLNATLRKMKKKKLIMS
jgi:dTDP-L-rhamnose 4-epimerase